MKKDKNMPAFETRLNHIRVTVWENTGNDGKSWFNTSVTRRYQDGDDWKDATTFNGLADLALVAEGVRMAQAFIQRADLAQGARSAHEFNE